MWDAFIGGMLMGSVSVAGKAATGNYRTGWDGREVVRAATGPSITVDGKKYQLLGYDAKGVPVYEDAWIVQEQETAKAGTQRGASGVVQEQPTAEVHNQAEKEESKNLYDHTAVDPFVKTAKYRRLYNYLEENTGIQRTAYERAKAMLHHRSGTKFEDLTYINTITGEQITRSDYNVENEVMPSRRMREMVQKSEPYTIVSLHNHAGSSVPSIADIQSAYKQKYKYGLIVCHNGMLMRYRVTDEYNYIVVQSLLDKAQKYLYNNDELALQRVLSDLKEANVLLEVFK